MILCLSKATTLLSQRTDSDYNLFFLATDFLSLKDRSNYPLTEKAAAWAVDFSYAIAVSNLLCSGKYDANFTTRRFGRRDSFLLMFLILTCSSISLGIPVGTVATF